MKNRTRSLSLAVASGAAAFLMADVIEATYWRWFVDAVQFQPWFLNAGRSVLFTATCITAAGALAGAVVREPFDKLLQCVAVTAGACAAMAAVLFVRGPGNIFPIVLIIGGAVILASAAAGTALSFLAPR